MSFINAMTKTIGIAIVCTNIYFVLGIRFVKRFMHFYKGNYNIQFYLFTDTDPIPYLPGLSNINYKNTTHNEWVDATNSKYSSIIQIENEQLDYIYYFDADTNISRDFTEDWFLGDIVGGQHFGDKNHMVIEGRPYDRNPNSKAYVPVDTQLHQVYYYGAFWGGKKDNVISLCKLLYSNQIFDKGLQYEPIWNDESYINQYFHYNPPTYTVPSDKFDFVISDKGGIENNRNANLKIEELKSEILSRANDLFDINDGRIVFYDNLNNGFSSQ